jgi:hypothetical protein
MDEQMIEDLMREFYLSASYDPKAARPADAAALRSHAQPK